MKSLREKFHDKWIPEPNSGCWIWTSPWRRTGYGYLQINRKNGKKKLLAHRVSYELYRGTIPNGMTVDHLCRTRCCVNPSHMEIVTSKENTLRGNNPAAQNARKTHCLLGHLLSGENLYTFPRSGYRQCRECTRISHQKNKRCV